MAVCSLYALQHAVRRATLPHTSFARDDSWLSGSHEPASTLPVAMLPPQIPRTRMLLGVYRITQVLCKFPTGSDTNCPDIVDFSDNLHTRIIIPDSNLDMTTAQHPQTYPGASSHLARRVRTRRGAHGGRMHKRLSWGLDIQGQVRAHRPHSRAAPSNHSTRIDNAPKSHIFQARAPCTRRVPHTPVTQASPPAREASRTRKSRPLAPQ